MDDARPSGQTPPRDPSRSFDHSIDRLIAVLGPTNTGKTYLAIERMLGHASGMIGFPLRLLARENYDRIVRLVGVSKVALITGEERIVPPNPCYFVCTVESMPLDRPVRFLAIDEVQMAADPERGHFFTDRLLNARGMDETMLLGADTIRPLLQRLAPHAEYVARPRFSTLSYTGPKKITRLPRRSAVVGFSAAEVYAIAELIRRQRGGAAVVMGALSPRTRNAQVEMFQNGDVDYIVATDAIGMGLNMDVGHVAFAGLRKFDGRTLRPLQAPELAQIAGRAGRHMNDGTFGTTAEVGPLDPALVEQIENHRFDPLKALMWRNPDLDFASPARLIGSLNELPRQPGLQRVRDSDDLLALVALTAQHDIARRAGSRQRVQLLWDVCQVPDFRKTMSEEHTKLLGQLFLHLTDVAERLPVDWVDRQIKRLERFDGDIDTLMSRIAHTRTWTYISNRSGWLDDAASWQDRTRRLEDRLSDALHERLMQRFVDRRTALLVRRLKDQEDFMASVADSGEVNVEGQFLGRIEGFRFVPDTASSHGDQRAVLSAALRVLRQDMPARLQRFAEAPATAFEILPDLRIGWHGAPVAYLQPGADILAPKVEVLPSDLLDGPGREVVRKRTADWLNGLVAKQLAELIAGRDADIGPAARGVLFQLAERLGVMPRQHIEPQLAEVDDNARKALARLGVRVGIYTVYLPTMLKPAAIRLRALLWAVWRGRTALPSLPAEGRTSIDLAVDQADREQREFLAAMGYLPLGHHAIRVDMVERLAASARRAVRESREAYEAYQRALAAHKAQAGPAGTGIELPGDANAGDTGAGNAGSAEAGSDVVTQGDEALTAADGEAVSVAQDAASVEPAGTIDATPTMIEAAIEAIPSPAPADGPGDAAGDVAEAPPAIDAPQTDAAAQADDATVSESMAGDSTLGDSTAGDATLGDSTPGDSTPVGDATSMVESAGAAIGNAGDDGEVVTGGVEASEATSETAAANPETSPAVSAEAPVPPPLPPGHFRATPEMMSYVGCSETEMTEILRDLGYRVHPPAEPDGPHSFSLVPRRLRDQRQPRRQDRSRDRAQDRSQDRSQDQPRRNRPHGQRQGGGRHQPAAPAEGEQAAAAPAPASAPADEGERHQRQGRARHERGERPEGSQRPREDRREQRQARGGQPDQRSENRDDKRGDKRRDDKRGDDRRGDRRDRRRDDSSRPDRTISTGPAVESPFAKLKELGLFK